MQNRWRFFYAITAMLLPLGILAQDNTRGDRSPIQVMESKAHTKVHLSRVEKKRHRVLFRKPKVQNTARYEFYKRVEEAAKEKQRLLKKLSKPQHSDFAYFGHKNKPKKTSRIR